MHRHAFLLLLLVRCHTTVGAAVQVPLSYRNHRSSLYLLQLCNVNTALCRLILPHCPSVNFIQDVSVIKTLGNRNLIN